MALLIFVIIAASIVAIQPAWRSILTSLVLMCALAAEEAPYLSAIAIAPRMLEFVILAAAFLLIASFYVLWRQVAAFSARNVELI